MQNSDVELTKLTDVSKKDKLVNRLVKSIINSLVKSRISYLERWEKVSFFERRNFGGKKEVCVVYVNTNQLEQAKAILESIENEGFSADVEER